MFAQVRNLFSGRTQVPAQVPIYAVLLVLGYLAFYGWLIATSGGFPYVMDNNESFSSLWHAINMDRFGLTHGYGLTDEAYGASPAAHPYVYTHQGNFPRLFAYAIYALGARSIDSQILVTTFTVGLAAVLLAYRFLGELTANRAFAALACAVIFSDYILVAQWQVVTYRVWHGFFFFAALLCVHAIEKERPLRATLLLLLCTACVFYFELVFAAFVAASTGLYALFRMPRRPGRLGLVAAGLVTGAAIGVGVLCTQIVLQIGWDNFVKDASYTFVSRNRFVDSVTLMKTLRAFYESNHIVFWYNLFDATGFRSPLHLGASIVYYELQPHTPYFILLLALPATGYLGAIVLARKASLADAFRSTRFARVSSVLLRWAVRLALLALTLVLPVALVAAHLLQRASRGEFGAVQAAGLALALPLVVLAFTRARAGSQAVGISMASGGAALLLGTLPSAFQYSYWVWTEVGHLPWPIKLFFGGYVCLLLVNFLLCTVRENGAALTPGRKAFEVSVFLASVLLLAVMLIGSPFVLGWRPLGGWLRGNDILLAVVATLAAHLAIVRLYGGGGARMRDWLVPGSEGFALLDRAWRFNLILFGIFVAQAMLFNQYYQPVWEALGDEVLAEPLLRVLMLLAVLLAHALLHAGRAGTGGASIGGPIRGLLPRVGVFLLAGYLAYTVVYMLTPGYVFTGYRFRLTPLTVFLTDVVIACGLWLVLRGAIEIAARHRLHRGWGIALGSLPILYWVQLQFAQVALFPPDQFAVFKTLASPPYRGASFVSNTYAAPVAAFTQHWAYIDPELAKAEIIEQDGRLRLKTDDSYVWLADRASNPAYARPEYFICIVPQSLPSLTAKLLHDRGDGEGYAGCAEMGLVKFAKLNRADVVPRATLVAIDEAGRRKFGHETWAIVKLDWGP